MFDLDTRSLLLLLGFFFIGAGVAGIAGKYKRWYWGSRRSIYAYVPFGFLFILVAIGQTMTDEAVSLTLRIAEFLVFGLAAWWVFKPPKFIRPAWIKMIEDHPKAIYEAMVAQVKEGKEWHSKVNDPELLEKWIKSIEKSLQKKPKSQ
jgi:hypothetical protein